MQINAVRFTYLSLARLLSVINRWTLIYNRMECIARSIIFYSLSVDLPYAAIILYDTNSFDTKDNLLSNIRTLLPFFPRYFTKSSTHYTFFSSRLLRTYTWFYRFFWSLPRCFVSCWTRFCNNEAIRATLHCNPSCLAKVYACIQIILSRAAFAHLGVVGEINFYIET